VEVVAQVNPRKSTSQALREQVELVNEQYQRNLNQRVAQQDRRDAFMYSQLEKLYNFKLNGWNPTYVQEFGKLQQHVAGKLANAEYDNPAAFLSDVSRLAGTHAGLDQHFQQRKDALKTLTNYVANPGIYPDKTVIVRDTEESIQQKDGYYFSAGIANPKANIDNLSIQGEFIGLDGKPIQIAEGVSTGDVLMHPHLGDTNVYFPTLEKRGDVSPEEFAQLFAKTVDGQLEGGVQGAALIKKIRAAMNERLGMDQDGMLQQSATNLFKADDMQPLPETEDSPGMDANTYYVNRALDYIQQKQRKITQPSQPKDPSAQQTALIALINSATRQTRPVNEAVSGMPSFTGAYPVEAGPVGETVYQTTHLLDKQSTTEGIDITKYLPEKYRPTSQATGVMDYTGTGGAAGTPKGVFVRPSLVAITDNGDYILRGLVGSSGDAYLPEEVRIPKEDKDKIQEISGRFTPVYGMTLEAIHQNYGSKVQSPVMFNGRKQ
jgi:hypothetical protein